MTAMIANYDIHFNALQIIQLLEFLSFLSFISVPRPTVSHHTPLRVCVHLLICIILAAET